MKILAYLRHYPPPLDGGAYYYNYHLVQQLSAAGFDITIITHKDVVPMSNAPLIVYPIRSVKTGRHQYHTRIEQAVDILSSVIAFRRILARQQFDWILTDAGYIQHLIVFLGAFLFSRRILGINFMEEISAIQRTTTARAFLQRWLLKTHVSNIVISRSMERLLKGMGVRSPTLLVYPCVGHSLALSKQIERKRLVLKYALDESNLIVGFLGRHLERKGVRNLILAVEELHRSGRQVSLLIAGQGPESGRLKNLIEENSCSGFCRMIGLVLEAEKTSFMSGIDVFATPNFQDPQTGDSEGFGIVFLEAAQQGTPVIGGQDGGTPEAISDNYNGLIVDGNSVDSIKVAIDQYYSHPALRSIHGENGKQWAERFNWQDQVKPLVDFLCNQ